MCNSISLRKQQSARQLESRESKRTWGIVSADGVDNECSAEQRQLRWKNWHKKNEWGTLFKKVHAHKPWFLVFFFYKSAARVVPHYSKTIFCLVFRKGKWKKAILFSCLIWRQLKNCDWLWNKCCQPATRHIYPHIHVQFESNIIDAHPYVRRHCILVSTKCGHSCINICYLNMVIIVPVVFRSNDWASVRSLGYMHFLPSI